MLYHAVAFLCCRSVGSAQILRNKVCNCFGMDSSCCVDVVTMIAVVVGAEERIAVVSPLSEAYRGGSLIAASGVEVQTSH